MKKAYFLTFIKSISALSFILVFLYGCNKEEVNKQADAAAKAGPVSMQDGTLKFDSEASLDLTIQKLSALSTRKELDNWEKQWAGFQSVRSAYNAITEADQSLISAKNSVENTKYAGFMTLIGEGEEREAVRNVTDDILATLVSKEGLIYVGEQAFHYSYARKVTIDNFSKYSKNELLAFAAAPKSSSEDVTSRVFNRKILKTGLKNTSDPNAKQVSCLNDYWHGGVLCCKKRMVGEIEALDGGGSFSDYEAVYARTKHQRRQSGIWYLDQAPLLRIDNSTVTVQDDNNFHTFYMENQSASDDGSFTRRFTTVANGVTVSGFEIHSWDSNHSAICDDQGDRPCYVYWQ